MGADPVDHIANTGNLSVVHIPEELQGQMQVVSGNPLDAIIRLTQPLQHPGGITVHIGRELNSDK